MLPVNLTIKFNLNVQLLFMSNWKQMLLFTLFQTGHTIGMPILKILTNSRLNGLLLLIDYDLLLYILVNQRVDEEEEILMRPRDKKLKLLYLSKS